MLEEWKIGDTGTVTINTSEKVVILLDENSEYNKSFVGGMKIPFYDWYNGSEGYDKMIFTWGYDGSLIDRIHYVWKQVLNSIDSYGELKMSNDIFLDEFPTPSAEVTEAVKQIADDICNDLYQKLDAIDTSVSNEEIGSFVRDLSKVVEDVEDNVIYVNFSS